MVNVGDKAVTRRIAKAIGYVQFSKPGMEDIINNAEKKKGSVFHTAKIAGIMAAKRTAMTIPLCHQVELSGVDMNLKISPEENRVHIDCQVQTEARTGVEMEAICGVLGAAATVYDMCKAQDRHMIISNVQVTNKQGGSNDFDV
ncbi:hypothetical protein CANCADRAFT_23088 [Tortispora caseinolytica NRRL Y-17796]|uniref:Molybdopterin cofactor biosynthesis C (MoaC) domain-containing protein n=1 Tax=Tortispora caseinolytica NRRL Y-17796 TaxID=767744 RepID=A0A1E4TK68_9ASCO|nr:hypothetical protein CANCADRAFT_23088 [Tortispora caseinolytica NRRL Y-17796]